MLGHSDGMNDVASVVTVRIVPNFPFGPDPDPLRPSPNPSPIPGVQQAGVRTGIGHVTGCDRLARR
jgi:hypothetical protein